MLGATGTFSQSVRQYLNNTRGKHEIKEIQKKSHVVHCTHSAGSVDVKVQNIFNARNNIHCSINWKYRTAAKLYTVETWLVTGMQF